MDKYVTGVVIRRLRENKKMTQEEFAEKIFVSSKAVSKWETGQGFPDISLMEPLAKALDISVIELLSGEDVKNRNRSSNVSRAKFYVCPVCGNVIQSIGEAVISCCGITLPPAIPEPADDARAIPDSSDDVRTTLEPTDDAHSMNIEIVEDEYYVTLDHPMTKDHYISFIAALSDQGIQFHLCV